MATATTYPENILSDQENTPKKNIAEANIYKTTFLLGMMVVTSAISGGDNNITRGLGYATASGFFLAPLANGYKKGSISNQATLALAGLITGAAFINSSKDFEHKNTCGLLGSITVALAGLSNLRSGRKRIHNALFGALSCLGGLGIQGFLAERMDQKPVEPKPLDEPVDLIKID